jgi:hypothetical protein
MNIVIIKKIFGWLAIGALFGVGLVVASMYTLGLYFPTMDNKEFIQDYISKEEKRMGVTCEELNKISLAFINSSIYPLIEAGRNGKDWVAVANPNLLEKVDKLYYKTNTCHLIQKNGKSEGIVVKGKFNKQTNLYSALRVFLTPWGDKQPSAHDLKPEAFEIVEGLYTDITSR